MAEAQMYLEEPQQNAVLGVPNGKGIKLNNQFYNAMEFDREGKRKEAERIYLELLNGDFENPVLMAALGMNYAIAEKNGLAHLLLSTAYVNLDKIVPAFKKLGITPKTDNPQLLKSFIQTKKSEIQNAIGTCWKHENNTAKAREWFEMAQADIAPNADIQNNLGTLYINEGNPNDALKHLDTAIDIDPKHGQAHWNRSLAWLEMGDYTRGWPEYEWGITSKVRVERNYTPANEIGIPLWDGSKDKTVIVYGEQGIGDEILFASMLPELIRDSKLVVFECHKKLHKLFANSFPTIDIYPTREDEIITWPTRQNNEPRYAFDAKIAIGSLGQFYRSNIDAFPGTPYLKPTPASELNWNEKLAALGAKPKIGISWIGGHKKTRIEVRSLALEQMLPILSQDATFISLQYTPCEDELTAFEAKHNIKIHHFPEASYSPIYDDTAGLVANLDLVITVCTSLVHLAGAMGVPTFVITPSRPAWRYRLDLDTMPWYKNTILYRQANNSVEWTPVIQEVAEALNNLLEIKNGV